MVPGGIQINIDGTPKEITEVIENLGKKIKTDNQTSVSQRQGKTSIGDLIGALIDGGFFKTPRDLASVKGALEEMGHHYPVTTLSVVLLRQVRRRNLRRLHENKRWVYVRS